MIVTSSYDCDYFQNAGAIIGKAGANIKRLRNDVSTRALQRSVAADSVVTDLEIL